MQSHAEKAEGRLVLQKPEGFLRLGQENDISLAMHDHSAQSAHIKISYYDSHGFLESPDVDLILPVLTRADGSAYVKIVPEKIGKLEISASVDFEDGKYDTEFIDAEVILPDRKPDRLFIIPSGGDVSDKQGTIYLGLSGSGNHIRLYAKAIYKNEDKPVSIPVKDVVFSLIVPPNTNSDLVPVVIDKATGTVTANQVGHALIQAKFQDLSCMICVDVLGNPSSGSDRTNCQELVPPDARMPAAERKGATPPPAVRPTHIR
jgi:hypothetical protein